MKLPRILSAAYCVVCIALSGYAQDGKHYTAPATDKSTPISINQVDRNGSRQGTWYVKTEALRGEPAIISTGYYYDNRKFGTWYNFDTEWRPISILKYSKGVLNGEAQYFENGKLVCIGNWRGLNPDVTHDTIWVYDPRTDYESEVVVPTEQGTMKHGIWKYYNPDTGQLIKEEEFQVGESIRVIEYTPTIYMDERKRKDYESRLPHNQPNKDTKPLKVKGSLTR